MRYLPIPAIILILLLPASLQGQYYQTGQDPASLKWLQVKTDKFTIIYPEKYGQAGIDYARSLLQAESDLAGLFPSKKFRIPVVIHNFSTVSNGYVAWAPRRIEIYPTPEQNAIPGDQFRLLSIHELTHVHQLKSLSRGFTGLMSVFLGEQAAGITTALLPLWYLEGDAVLTETALTNSGRGRSPAFQKQLKAIALDRGNYRYDKIINGSYRDFVPDHYESGYQMVAWAVAMHDTSIWNKVLRFTGNYPFTINPVNLSLSRNTGLNKRKLYMEAFDSLRNIWSRNLPSDTRTYERINPVREERYVSYHSPVFAGKDSIVAIRTSLSSTTSIVLVDASGGAEKVLHRPGRLYPYLVSYGGGKLVWVESRPDPRWNNRDYSVIMSMDLHSGKTSRLSYKTRYLAASVSPDGSTVSAVENTVDNLNKLVFLDAETGDMLYSVPSPSNYYIQNPQWSENGNEVTVIYLDGKGEGAMSYSTATSNWETLIPPGDADLQAAFLRNDSLFYVSSHSGTENIYVKTPAGTRQITRSVYGAINPDLQGRQLIFSDYTLRGNSISMTSIDEASAPRNDDNDSSFLINRLDEVSDPVITSDIPVPDPVRYRKALNLFRFHSWLPLYADLDAIQSDPLSIRPGFTIMSQNSLSTLITTLGYEYTDDGKHVLHSKLTWQGWYPVIESRIDYGYYRRNYDQEVSSPGLLVSNQVYIPLMFSSGHFSQYLRPSIISEYINTVYPLGQGKYDFEQWNFTARLFFSNYSRVARRDIYPKWAQAFDLNYVFSPFDRDLLGTTTYIKTAFYFPGFFRDNGIKLRLEAERQHPSKYIYPNRASFPRGFNDIATPGGYGNIISNELLFASADYVFPVAYPDFSLANLLYLKRIRSGFFYDFAAGTGNRYFRVTENGSSQSFIEGREYFSSYGAELLADFHVFRIPFEISGGIQAAWKPGDDMPVFKVLFNVDLFGFTLGGKQER
jgi:hypothetical protein